MYIGRNQATTSVQCGNLPLPCDVSSSYDLIVGGYAATSGQIVRASGARIGETGGYQVPGDTSDVCRYYTTQARWFCGLKVLNFVPGNGNYHWDQGDSGGPIYMVLNTYNYYAVGIISGKHSTGLTFCYTPIARALADFSVTLVTT